MRFLTLLCAPLLLAACVVDEPAIPPEPDACNAAALQGLVGQPAAAARAMELPAGTRIVGPGDPVTADFRPDRLNIEIGADGRVARVACF